VPANGGKSTTFACTADFGSGASPALDGPIWACVIAADASIPDNPNGPDQRQSAEKANLSAAKCDGVLLDRTPPQVAISGSTASAKVGDLVTVAAQASDAGSGLAGGYEWTWGDNTAKGSGATATHTFTQPGTYAVRVATSDAAGNAATATKLIQVSARSTGGGTAGGGGSTAGGGTTGGTTTPAGTTGGGSAGTPAGSGAIEVSAPRKLKLGRAKAVPVTLSTQSGGKASFALVRSGRVIARGAAVIGGAGTTAYRLKLPRKAKAGSYRLKVTFTATGGKVSTWTRKVTLQGKKAKTARKASAAGVRAPRVSAKGAPVALPDGRFHGERKRTFVARALAG
jgi:plastocyanin